MKFLRHTLPNGLEIIAESNESAHSLGLGFFVQTGARDETDEVAGVSHFLEHMVFKGTPRRSAEDVNREFDEMGAHYNAYTSEENTVYYATILPEYQASCVDLLADIMRPSLREDDFEMEKKVILEEIEMYLDQPPFGMDDRLKELCFGSHPIARSVLGTSETVGALTPAAMKSYFNSRYSPSNLVLAASGRVDFEALVEQAEQACGDWDSQNAKRELPGSDSNAKKEFVQRDSAMQQYALLLSGGPDGRSEDRYAAKLLSNILGDDSGSRLYWNLIDPGIAESASLGHYDYQDVGMFYTWLSCEPDRIEEVLQKTISLLSELSSKPITDSELKQAKSKFKSRLVLSSEKPRNRLFGLGGGWLMRGDYRPLSEDLRHLDEVTIDDLQEVANQYPLEEASIISVGPLSEVALA